MAIPENSTINANNGARYRTGVVGSSRSQSSYLPTPFRWSWIYVGGIDFDRDGILLFWSCAMEVALVGKNKLCLVDGSTSKEDFGAKLGSQWDRCNASITSWLMSNKICAAFKERFDKVNGSRLYYLHKEIFTLTEGISSVSTYFIELKDLWAEYDSILPPPPSATKYIDQLDYQWLLQFLMGLNDSFEQARSQILLMPTLPSIDKAYAMVVHDESRKMIAGNAYGQSGHTDPTALFIAHSTSRPRRNYNLECEFCHLKGHTKNECYKLMKCEFCNKTGHRKENCYKIVGYPFNFKQKKKANAVMIDTTGQQDLRNPQATYQPGSSVETAQLFTKEQYNQLLQLLNKNSIGEASVNMAARQTRVPFSTSTSRSLYSFDLIHMDVWGPYKVATQNGMRYFLMLVDDSTRWTWVFLMRLKSDVIFLLKNFIAMIKTQFGKQVKVFRSDNGSEFFNSACKDLFRSHGNVHQSSCPYTPEQNGVVERRHSHILETTRAIRFQGHLPVRY
ncbi:PREDICTED: uncharacterized protein LOC109229959 [Nicotiana attenuata]|uniref:uncharacterized protein LOC109229959 n=1 Tax=Nicotiana attenuata TaxID=49451 RepID=UPI0009047FB6|nr:PREDICTED: uncharacterized protein LOC109229959 [Nicotiana attenuata]